MALSRRRFLSWSGAGAIGAALIARRTTHLVAAGPKMVTIVEFSAAGIRGAVQEVEKVVKTDAEWRRQLAAISYEVTRKEGTERPFTGATWNLHDRGIYRCVCCGTALFSSETKFESGTGWPSFWQPLDRRNVNERADLTLGMERTAVECKRCDAHIGHVFDDGPRPTGLRYCMNSAAMTFVKA
jgi:peptide-methionine (R)-S-oxide reductase